MPEPKMDPQKSRSNYDSGYTLMHFSPVNFEVNRES